MCIIKVVHLVLLVKYLQLTKQSDAQSVEIMKDLNHIEIASTQMEQHLTEIIAYVEDVIVSEDTLLSCTMCMEYIT